MLSFIENTDAMPYVNRTLIINLAQILISRRMIDDGFLVQLRKTHGRNLMDIGRHNQINKRTIVVSRHKVVKREGTDRTSNNGTAAF